LNSFIQVDATQTNAVPVKRAIPLSTYLLTGAVLFLALSAIIILFLPSTALRLYGADAPLHSARDSQTK